MTPVIPDSPTTEFTFISTPRLEELKSETSSSALLHEAPGLKTEQVVCHDPKVAKFL